jgi:hypothetical protein
MIGAREYNSVKELADTTYCTTTVHAAPLYRYGRDVASSRCNKLHYRLSADMPGLATRTTPRTASSCARGSETRGIGGGGTGSHAKRSPEPGGRGSVVRRGSNTRLESRKTAARKGDRAQTEEAAARPTTSRKIQRGTCHPTRPDPTRPDPPRKCERAKERRARRSLSRRSRAGASTEQPKRFCIRS